LGAKNDLFNSFSSVGNTERSILENITEIVNTSLPISKVSKYYREVEGTARIAVLGYVTFTNSAKDVSICGVMYGCMITI